MVITRDGTHTGDDNDEHKETKRTPGRGATGSRDAKPIPNLPTPSNVSANDDSPLPALSQTTQGLNLSSPKGIFNNNNNNTAYAGGFGNQHLQS